MARLLTPRQTADQIGLALQTLAKLRMFGGGPPFVKLGRRVLYPEGELHAWIEARPRFENTAEITVARSRQRSVS